MDSESQSSGNSKKRNSICLATTHPLISPQQSTSLTRNSSFYDQSRKNRRFSETMGNLPKVSNGHLPNRRSRNGRRSSLVMPKTSWGEDGVNFGSFGEDDLNTGELMKMNLQFQPISAENVLAFDIPAIEKMDNYDKLESKTETEQYFLNDLKAFGVVHREDVLGDKKFCRKGAWTKEEDELLIQYGGSEGNKNKNWTEIAEKIPGRTAKQCRERWCFNLDPTIKKELWSVEEDMLLISKQSVVGNKWAQIAQLLPGRTENAVKTRFKSIMRARKREWKPQEDLLLLDLHQQLGANWEGIATQLESHRTKHAVKMRFKELQQGLVTVKTPENGSARQTVRQMLYPKETLQQVSDYYKSLSDGTTQLERNSSTVYPSQNVGSLEVEEQQTFDEFFNAFCAEDEPLVFA